MDCGGLSGWNVGVLANFETIEQESEIRMAFSDVLGIIEESGADIRTLDLAGFDPAATRRAGLLISEAEAAFALKSEMSTSPATISVEFLKMLEYGRDAPAWRLVKAQRMVAECGNAFRRLFDEVDLVATPTTPQTAFSFERAAPDNQAEFAAIANFSGCPALSLPCSLSSDGLPVGVHLIAPPFQETRLLGAAAGIERALGFELAPPEMDLSVSKI
jgi:aspartyl-tRNA(Asn)/glutamyl-tRNA(Gln) amidotransferase subunit A